MDSPIFDESALTQLHELQEEGEPSFVGGLISDYLVQVRALNQEIQTFETKSDKAGLERVAHKLKSSSAVLGLNRVAGLCSSIEDAARAGKETHTAVAALESASSEAISILTLYLAQLTAM